jgi:hypothetical protein
MERGNTLSPATLRIVRDRQRTDALVPYRVLIDDVEVGKVKSGSTTDFTVAPGEHTLQLIHRRLGTPPPRSNLLRVLVPAGGVLTVGCHSSLSYAKSLAMGLAGAPVSVAIQEL